jgi:hypothetical protein
MVVVRVMKLVSVFQRQLMRMSVDEQSLLVRILVVMLVAPPVAVAEGIVVESAVSRRCDEIEIGHLCSCRATI